MLDQCYEETVYYEWSLGNADIEEFHLQLGYQSGLIEKAQRRCGGNVEISGIRMFPEEG